MSINEKLEQLIKSGEAPEWLSSEALQTLSQGYFYGNDETPKELYKRVSTAAATRLKKPELAKIFFDLIWKNWLGLASPVASNMGTVRGMPISCFSCYVPDSVDGIYQTIHELAVMTKHGGGVATHWNGVRHSGSQIGEHNGFSDGVIPFLKVQDATTVATSQGGVRRGATAGYLPINHGDIKDFLKMRRPQGDVNRQCLNIHHGVCIDDEFMNKIIDGDFESREIWKEILRTRYETGEPYIFFSDTVNNNNPESYKKNNLKVKGSNICCLSENTLVATINGPEKISKLIGKTVEIWDGNQWVENNSFKYYGDDELIRIHISDGSYIDSNENHRWFIASSYDNIRKNKYIETLTKNLKIGQFIESHSVEFHGNTNMQAAYLKGFLLGDGTSTNGRPSLRLHSSKYMCQSHLLKSALEIKEKQLNTNALEKVTFSSEYTPKKNLALGNQKLKNMRGLTQFKKELYDWTKLYKKKLPDNIFSLSKNSKLEFLSGLFDADGTLGKNGLLQLSSIHKDFIESLQLLIKSLGYSCSIDQWVRKNDLNTNLMYRITVGSFDSYHLIRLLSCERLKNNFMKKPNRKSSDWCKITKIEKLKGKHPVYCPILPTTGKFGLANGLMTGNTEIMLHTDEEHSFVCCLSSMNLAKYDEWKNTDAVYYATWFLDAVLQEFIEKAKSIKGFERAVRFSEKSRAIGLGVMGFHTLLQDKMLPVDSFETFKLNAEIFKLLDKESLRASKDLAREYGEPEWCEGFGVRNTHRIALAPTVSNSIISGNVSPSIEPWPSNSFARKTAKGTFIHRNKALEKILITKDKNVEEVWNSIVANNGSVQHLSFLTKEEKEVFLTAREINQFAIVKLAGQRQRWIDQGQSVNLFFPSNVDPKYFHEVHMAAWKEGLKSLYYCRTESILKGDQGSRAYKREINECKACEG